MTTNTLTCFSAMRFPPRRRHQSCLSTTEGQLWAPATQDRKIAEPQKAVLSLLKQKREQLVSGVMVS